ncbi:MAG: alpha-glucosidase [Spirochaetia bacterium]|nr:alpha-glucosidase [Spirochaetia bacterium]
MARIVLVGAGSAMFGGGAIGDICKSKALEGSTIVLHDINPNALSSMEQTSKKYISDYHLDYNVEATVDRKQALAGADFCIISIEVGDRYALWETDWHVPLQFGIKQVYGENGGPGGIFHALRIIPPIIDICQDVQDICPNCLVINLSNPMTPICMAIKKKFPDLKVIGLCHEVSSLLEHLPKILGTPFDNLQVKAGGLNHFSVLLQLLYKDTGRDAYPQLLEKASSYFASTKERSLFLQILKYFKRLPITTDSHFSEYIHWAQEVADHDGVLDFYYNYKKECLGHQIDPYKRIQEGTAPIEYWRVVPIIEGILTNSGHEELAVNLPNRGLIAGLPEDVVVEVPAIIDAKGVHGVPVSDLMPSGFKGLLSNRSGVLDLTVQAALTGDRDTVLQALLVDTTNNSLLATEKMLDTIITLEQPYLDYIQ